MRIFNATITDANGNIQSGASITVRDEATSALITLYDIDDNVIGNPFLTGLDGLCQFKILDDRYVYVLAEYGGESQEWRFVPMFDYEVRFNAVETDVTAVESRTTIVEAESALTTARVPAGRIVPSMFTEDPAVLGVRQINLLGQIVEIADYQEACDNLYVGDANNATAPAFYRTSDALGATRDAAGNYMVMPDTRGLSLKNIGDATISGRTKTGPTELGEVQEDQGQGGQVGSAADDTGARNYWAKGQLRNYAHNGTVTANHETVQFNTTAQGVAQAVKLMDDGTNGDPRTGLNTRDSTIGCYWSVIY